MRWLISCLVLLLCLVVVPQSKAISMLVGENWLGGQPVGNDLVVYGGSIYNTYFQAPQQDGEPNRVRLMRYPYMTVNQAQVANMSTKSLWWALGNENNNTDQDGGLITDSQAAQYVIWYHDNVAAIKAGDPTAKVLGPSIWNWYLSGAGARGVDAYNRFLAVYKSTYGTVPVVDALALHLYPARYELNNFTEAEFDEQLQPAIDYATTRGWGLGVTEWSFWAEQFTPTCGSAGQSVDSQYHFVQHGLQSMAQRGVLMSLFFGNIHQACDNNGHAAWLFNADNSLTASGRAHRDFVQGVVPPVNTNTVVSMNTATIIPTTVFTRTNTPLVLTLIPTTAPTNTLVPTATVTRTATLKPTATFTTVPTKTPASGCVPTFIKKC